MTIPEQTKPRVRVPFLNPVAFFLLVAAAALLVRNHQLTKVIDSLDHGVWGFDAEGLSQFLAAPHPTAAGTPVVPRQIAHKYLLVTIFKPSDCVTCTEQFSRLNSLAPGLDLQLVGVSSFFSQQEAVQEARGLGLDFTLVVDGDGALLKKIAPRKTPWTVLIATKTGTVLFETPPAMDGNEARYQVDQMRRTMLMYQATAL